MPKKKITPSDGDDININDDTPEETNEKIDEKPTADWTLFQRVVWVRDRVTRLGKDASVGTGNSSYKAITHDKVTAFIRPKLCQAGIMSWITCLSATDEDTGALTQKGRRIVQHRAKFAITFANVNDKDDSITVEQYAYADDFGDKAPGKATSYAMKYAMLKTFMVETGEEDEERIDHDGGHGATIGDDDNMVMEIDALADELFGDRKKEMLDALAKRRFFVDHFINIEQNRYNDVIRALRVGAAQMNAKEGGDDAKQE